MKCDLFSSLSASMKSGGFVVEEEKYSLDSKRRNKVSSLILKEFSGYFRDF